MNTAEQIIETFKNEYGLDIEIELQNNPTTPMTPLAFVNRCKMILELEINECGNRIEDLEPIQDARFETAWLEQIYYTLMAGDFTTMVGYNASTNTLIDLNQMRARKISPMATQILTSAGLLYRGLRKSMNCDRPFRGF